MLMDVELVAVITEEHRPASVPMSLGWGADIPVTAEEDAFFAELVARDQEGRMRCP